MFDSISDSPKVTVSYSANPWLKWRKSTGTRSFKAFSLSSFFPKFPVTQQRLPKDVPLNNSPMALLFFFVARIHTQVVEKLVEVPQATVEIGDLNFVWCGRFSLTLELWILDLFGMISNVLPCLAAFQSPNSWWILKEAPSKNRGEPLVICDPSIFDTYRLTHWLYMNAFRQPFCL